jgi:hypothetical protein
MLETFIEETCSGILKDPLAMPPSPQLKKIVWSLCSLETWAESFLKTEKKSTKKNSKTELQQIENHNQGLKLISKISYNYKQHSGRANN